LPGPEMWWTAVALASCASLRPCCALVHAPIAQAAAVAPRAELFMGRAEKRMAKKRAKKTGGAAPVQHAARNDVVPKEVVMARLREIPVFGLSSGSSDFLTAEDGAVALYLSAREAERAKAERSSDPSLRVQGRPLSELFFDSSIRCKAADAALKELRTIPTSRLLTSDISVPLFCIDGLQTTDKTTQVASLPFFLRKSELLEFAGPVYGAAEAAERVLATDLSVVVTNMCNGPAGLLKDARFFPDNADLQWMDEQERKQRTAMFPDADGLDLEPPRRGLFGGLFP